MLRFATSLVSSFTESIGPLLRTPQENAIFYWKKIVEQVQAEIANANANATANGSVIVESVSNSNTSADDELEKEVQAWTTLLAYCQSFVEVAESRSFAKMGYLTTSTSPTLSLPSIYHADTPSNFDEIASINFPSFQSPQNKGAMSKSRAFEGIPDHQHLETTDDLLEMMDDVRTDLLNFFIDEHIIETLCANVNPAKYQLSLGVRLILLKTLTSLINSTLFRSVLSVPSDTSHKGSQIISVGNRILNIPSIQSSISILVSDWIAASYAAQVNQRKFQLKPLLSTPFLQFCFTLCSYIQSAPHLLHIIIQLGEQKESPTENIFVSAMCSMINYYSHDGRLALQSLLLLLHMSSNSLERYIFDRTCFCEALVVGLTETFALLPPISSSSPFSELLTTNNAAKAFQSRLEYIDTICATTDSLVSSKICRRFRSTFCEKVLPPLLLNVREDVVVWTTLFTRNILLSLTSRRLFRTIASFLLYSPPVHSDSATADSSPANIHLRMSLIKRIDSLSDTLCVATLHLFISLLQSHDIAIIHNLMTRNFLPGYHLHPECRESHLSSSHIRHLSKINERDLLRLFDGLQQVGQSPNYQTYLIDSQEEVQIWVREWNHQLLDIDRLTDDVFSLELLSIQQESKSLKDISPSEQEQPDEVFFEGLFLHTIFNKLENIMSGRPECTLLFTRLLSIIMQCPHPLLHSYFLDQKLLLAQGTRRPLHIIAHAVNNSSRRAARLLQFDVRREEARLRWEGNYIGNPESVDLEQFFTNSVIMEEFIKELCSIAESKSQLASMAQTVYMSRTPRKIASAASKLQR